MTFSIVVGDAADTLRGMDQDSVHCCVTSPPYWGLRDYGAKGQIGLESTVGEFLERIVEVFRGVRRVLRDDGTLWVNLGDSYAGTSGGSDGKHAGIHRYRAGGRTMHKAGLPRKNLVGVPWRVALALQDDGWILRSDIVWHKPCPMPESVQDRPTRSHEYVFLLTKGRHYHYDADAVRTPLRDKTRTTYGTARKAPEGHERDGYVKAGNFAASTMQHRKPRLTEDGEFAGANLRTVWTIAPEPFKGAHFAVFPTALVEPCIKSGCPPGGLVLDPFAGSGTTGVVANRLGRDFVGVELNPEYAEMARRRIKADAPLFNSEVAR